MLNLVRLNMTQKVKRGEIWLANLNPGKKSEPGKTRPVLILQDQALLDISHSSTVVIPLTTKLINDTYPLRVRVAAQDQLEKDSDLLIDQIRAIDNSRLSSKGPLTRLDEKKLSQIYAAVFEVIGVS